MSKSIFGVSAGSTKLKRETLYDVSARIVKLIDSLSKIEPDFSKPYFVGKYDIDLHQIKLCTEGVGQLAELILKYAKGDIALYEKVGNPDTQFARDFGFSALIRFESRKNLPLFLSTNFGSVSGGGASIHRLHKDDSRSFDWYFKILKCIVDHTDADTGSVSFSNSAFIDLVTPLKIKYPLGWISYFDNSFDTIIPNDLREFEYETSDKGKYLILSRSDITLDKEVYLKSRTTLIEAMRYIKHIRPEYSKE